MCVCVRVCGCARVGVGAGMGLCGAHRVAAPLPGRQGWMERSLGEERQGPLRRSSAEPDTHLGLERPQVEQVEVTGQ